MEKNGKLGQNQVMIDRETARTAATSGEANGQASPELASRVRQLEAEVSALEQENKALRFQFERALEYRQKSHCELVLLLTSLVSKLPINDIGVIVSRLVEHNSNVTEFMKALTGASPATELKQPALLKTLDQTKRDLTAALKPIAEELIGLAPPLETETLRSLMENPDLFFSPRVVRATRCYVKGLAPRERIVRDFGEAALVLFNDLTTDPKFNPRPKQEEIVLGFKEDFPALFERDTSLEPAKRERLLELYRRVQASKAQTAEARAQKIAFVKFSFLIELIHYYEHQATEAPDVMFARRLPALIEQLVLPSPEAVLEERSITPAEDLLQFIISPDHRQMVINNLGKTDRAGKLLKHVMRLRGAKAGGLDADHAVAEFIRFVLPSPPEKAPSAQSLATLLRLFKPEMQRLVIKAVMVSDRVRKEEGEELGKNIAAELGLKAPPGQAKEPGGLPPEVERQIAWAKVQDLIARRADPASIAAAIRDRLNAKYDAEEIRQSWLTLIEADSMTLIRILCHLPYLPGGKTDAIARPVLQTYVGRLVHEKYASTYHKITTSLKNMYHAKPDSPTLVNFLALVRWAEPGAADKLCADVGMPVPA